jgi:hypothetical protein
VSTPLWLLLIILSDVLRSGSGRAKVKGWGQGSAEGRPRSGRRSLTPTRLGACWPRRRTSGLGCVAGSMTGSPVVDIPDGCQSFLRRARRHGVRCDSTVGGVNQMGATTQ